MHSSEAFNTYCLLFTKRIFVHRHLNKKAAMEWIVNGKHVRLNSSLTASFYLFIYSSAFFFTTCYCFFYYFKPAHWKINWLNCRSFADDFHANIKINNLLIWWMMNLWIIITRIEKAIPPASHLIVHYFNLKFHFKFN
jgi:hypothetical protein